MRLESFHSNLHLHINIEVSKKFFYLVPNLLIMSELIKYINSIQGGKCVLYFHQGLICMHFLMWASLGDVDNLHTAKVFCTDFLKGQDLLLFMNQFPLIIPLAVSNFFENSRRYSQVKVHHRYQRHRWQIFPPVLLVLLTPVSNLSPVSTIPAAN
jgi:hypothetical protein